VGKYLEIAEKALEQLPSHSTQDRCSTKDQSLRDENMASTETTLCEISELSEISTDTQSDDTTVDEWSELLENKDGELQPDELQAAIEMVEIMRMRERGQIPDHYTGTTTCNRCGPVPIWEGCSPEVKGCPWCFNRIQGLQIPTVATE